MVFDSTAGANIELHIALAHLWSSDTFPKSAEIDGGTATRQKERKNSRYKQDGFLGGTSIFLTSLVLEHYARWDEDEWKFLQWLAEQPSDKFV